MARQCTVGLVTDPDVPERVAQSLANTLPGALGEEWECCVEVEVDPVAAGQHDVQDILQALARQTAEHSWDYAICLTDLPLRRERRPVLAEINRAEGVAVVALPSLGGVQTRRRARQLVAQILDEFDASERAAESGNPTGRWGLQSTLTQLIAPIHRTETTTRDGAVDVRYHATRRRGRLRLLTGMVRTNRPWRLIFGMSSALAAAIATSAFGLSSSTIWQLAAQLDVGREAGAAAISVVLLVGWLIAAHRLWERPSGNSNGHDRELARIYNFSTVATLAIGVGCLYIGLFAINLGVALFLVPSELLSSMVGGSGFGIYVALAWGFTTMGVIAGALGSSLESDEAVRQAAYGYREQQRRAEREQREQQREPRRAEQASADDARVEEQQAAEETPTSDEPAADEAATRDEPAADGARAVDSSTVDDTRTKDELYADAQRRDIRGRSDMSKQQLLDALQRSEDGGQGRDTASPTEGD